MHVSTVLRNSELGSVEAVLISLIAALSRSSSNATYRHFWPAIKLIARTISQLLPFFAMNSASDGSVAASTGTSIEIEYVKVS